jgi:hypothetical protein
MCWVEERKKAGASMIDIAAMTFSLVSVVGGRVEGTYLRSPASTAHSTLYTDPFNDGTIPQSILTNRVQEDE